MRTLVLAASFFAFSACGPDLLVGTFTFTMSGTDTTSGSNASATSGTGHIAITPGKTEGYVLTLAQLDSEPCVFNGALDKNKAFTLTLAANQACTISGGGASATATLTSGTVAVVEDALTMTVAYTYQGSTLFGSFSGNGTRTYAGTRR